MSERSARFVEAITDLLGGWRRLAEAGATPLQRIGAIVVQTDFERRCREAIEAFADATCELKIEGGLGLPYESWEEHAACRAALLKECGLV